MVLAPSHDTAPTLDLFKIQRSCVYDGPGVRTTLFFRGCNLRCLWCQNPEGQDAGGAAAPRTEPGTSIDDAVEVILRDRQYHLASAGGVTLSGGDPCLQDPRRLLPLLQRLRHEGLPVAVETSLDAPPDRVAALVPWVDLFLVDLKIVDDDALHLKYTRRDSALIRQNLAALLKAKVRLQFRMVMVPGCTDTDRNLESTARFLRSAGHDRIELLKYFNFYEEKARRLGLKTPLLHITMEQSQASLERGVAAFRARGIAAHSVDLGAPRKRTVFTPRVQEIQRAIRESPRAICLESARLKTEYYQQEHGFEKPTPIHRAERLAHVLRHKQVIVYPGELLVGNFTAKRVAAQAWEELFGAASWLFFMPNIETQKPVSYQMTRAEKLYFATKLVPYWFKRSLTGMMFPLFTNDIHLQIARTAEMVAGFNNNLVMIAHYVEHFPRILSLGTEGLIAEVEATRRAHPEQNPDFYRGAIIALEALQAFGQRYAEELARLGRSEADPARRRELEELAEVCAHVPRRPASTFHEALQCMLLTHVALCLESYENAISFGRLDQILWPYYQRDLAAGRITPERAQELLALFILKQDEVVFVNDGGSIMRFYKSFETITTDQTLTFGGVDRDGRDATNDLTYMLLDCCELQPLCVDPSARVHPGSPDRYLRRLAEVHINGCPMPKVNNDEVYVEALRRHYDTSLADARDYAIVGCVEPCASGDHFGNTDCANVNLALPFIQALKGHEHDLWRFGPLDQWWKIHTNTLEWLFEERPGLPEKILARRYRQMKAREQQQGLMSYRPPADMDELLRRFQARLDAVTGSILADHQKIEGLLRQHFQTPLGSALSPGCVASGKDLYEGGATHNSSGIQAVGVVDVADSLCALDEVVFKKHLYSLRDVLAAMDADFEGAAGQRIRAALLAAPKFGDDASPEPTRWVTRVMAIFNAALESVPGCPRNGRYSAGYYALNVGNRYGKKTPALPSGRLYGVPLANSIIPHYGMEQADLLSSLNAIAGVDFREHAENGTTVTFSIDAALFQGESGPTNLASIYRTFFAQGGMQLQPNVVSHETLLDAYAHPENHRYLMVRIAGYCAYFNDLSDEMKLSIINRTCYSRGS
jgi:pyruvate-formate lyase/pyruvate-formate lyase-activating enzyme